MKKLIALLCAILMTATMIVPAFAVEIIGQVLSTDIRAYINGAEIPAYNIDGRLAIVVSDLNNYGFRTSYNNDLRKSSVTRNPYASSFTSVPSKASGLPIGARVMDVYKSDITVELDGRPVQAFNVDNRMAIYFSDLKDYGTYVYDNNLRTSSITLTNGASVYVEPEPLTLKIMKQPQDFTVRNLYDAATYTVGIAGGKAPYTYSWFVDEGSYRTVYPMRSSSYASDSFTFDTNDLKTWSASESSLYVGCEITDANGSRITTSRARLSFSLPEALKITKQPQDFTVKNLNSPASYSITVSGGTAPYTFSWNVYEGNLCTTYPVRKSTNGSDTFVIDSNDLREYSGSRYALYVVCTVTDSAGSIVNSSAAKLLFKTETLKITKQPQDVTVSGQYDKASFSITVSGGEAPYSYNWYVDEGYYRTAFPMHNSTKTSDTFTLDSYDLREWSGTNTTLYVGCTVVDSLGNEVTSSRVKLTIKNASPLKVAKEPTDYTLKQDLDAISFSVTVSGGRAPYTYSWYIEKGSYRISSYTTTTSSSTTDSVTFDRFDRMIWDDAGADGTVYVICQITDSNGDQVLTRKAKFVYSSVSSSKPTISVQPRDASSDAEGFATYTVQIKGGKAPYTYDWYVDVSGYVELAGTDTTSNTFDTISLSTDFYPTYTSTVQVYCIISDAYGQSVTTKKVSMKP